MDYTNTVFPKAQKEYLKMKVTLIMGAVGIQPPLGQTPLSSITLHWAGSDYRRLHGSPFSALCPHPAVRSLAKGSRPGAGGRAGSPFLLGAAG